MNRPWLSRLSLRALDTTKFRDYAILAAICGIPSVLAVMFGIGDSITVEGQTYVGWFDKYNFWPFVFVQPLGLLILRLAFRLIADISAEQVPASPPPLVQLFRHADSRQEVYTMMRDWIASPKVMGTALCVSAFIQLADLQELLGVYLFNNPVRVSELDWSVMYQAGVISKTTNGMFCVFAYVTQFTITTLGIWGMAFLTAHNLFFLRRIYQRSRDGADNLKHFITLDLDDVNRCFGFRVANNSFNTQVIALTIAGIIILMSRFANASVIRSDADFETLITRLSSIEVNLFPDIGQIMLAIGWVVALAIVTLPALVKLAPRVPFLGGSSALSIDTYLREFLTDDQWQYGDKPTEQQINIIAARFANNGFWPTGDNRASLLFFFSFWVSLVILYPVDTGDIRLLVPSLLILGVVAYGMRTILLKILNGSLTYVDERLTTPRPDLLQDIGHGVVRIRGKVFISYRREDSLAYARLLKQSLGKYLAADRLFMDLDAIRDGQDFIDIIESAIKNCESVIVVIGPSWSTCTDADGVRRLDKGDDFVRLEIASAFAENKFVVPVLVGNAKMPGPDELTADISPLWRRHARELSDSRWEYDVGELAKAIADAES